MSNSIPSENISMHILAFKNYTICTCDRLKLKCKVCKMEFPDEHHLNHKKVHGEN